MALLRQVRDVPAILKKSAFRIRRELREILGRDRLGFSYSLNLARLDVLLEIAGDILKRGIGLEH